MLEEDVVMQDALERGYANYSSIARILKPKIEEMLGRSVKTVSIVTSVKRTGRGIVESPSQIRSIIAKSVINVRSDVVKVSIEKTRRTVDISRRLLAESGEDFLQLSESTSAITLIFDEKVFKDVIDHFQKSEILEERNNLGAITVHSPNEIITTPGCAISFYNRISRRRINIEDTVSCFTDTIIVVKMSEIGKAFAALSDLVNEARQVLTK
ncbi:MAG: hypothetical protein ACE5KG_00905 [Nitrososphaerales archaeon]